MSTLKGQSVQQRLPWFPFVTLEKQWRWRARGAWFRQRGGDQSYLQKKTLNCINVALLFILIISVTLVKFRFDLDVNL